MHYHMLCGRIGGRCRNDLTIYFITIFSNYYESNCGKQVLPLRFTKCFFFEKPETFELWIRYLPVELFAQVVHFCQRLHHL